MTKWIGMAVLALMLMTGGSAAIASAEPSQAAAQQQQTAKAPGSSARRRVLRHHDRYAYRSYDRPYEPTYYDRPTYYAPAPFFPFLGIGYGPWW